MMLIQAYTSQWMQDFESLRQIIQAAVGQSAIGIEHIGSTAVPGLAAKPIIDIDMVYDSDEAFLAIKTQLQQLGYYHNGDQGIPQREVFKRNKELPQHPVLDHIPHHLYVCPSDSEELARHLSFRNYLRAHEAAREEYAAIKYAVAVEANQDRKVYAALKQERARDFVDRILNAG